ncbi:MAG: SMC-Scp complex subunit ScpB [archaeon]|nr:SMC-Scp complex subunit ScpB [archaeon]
MLQELKKEIEAALFMASKPLSVEELAHTLKLKESGHLQELLDALIEDYSKRDTALEIAKEGTGYRMRVKEDYEENVMQLAGATEFGKSVMKTLAYIAYRQPVRQAQVIRFRTSKAYEEIHLLLDKGLISKEKYSNTFILRTTQKFLQYFGSNAVKLKPNPKAGIEQTRLEKADS